MQGLVTNLTTPLNSADGALTAGNGANGLNSGLNSTSASGGQGFSPLFGNLLSASAQSGQTPFTATALNLLPGQELPPEGQFLPPGAALEIAKRTAQQASLNGSQLKGEIPSQVTAEDLRTPESSQFALNQLSNLSEDISRGLHNGTMNTIGTAGAQSSGQGQQRLQQELLQRQLSLTPVAEEAEGDSRLVGQSASLNGDAATTGDQSRQLFTLMREAMQLRQQPTALSSGGGETRISDNFGSAMGALNSLGGDAKSTGEARSVMQGSINSHFSQQAEWGQEMASRVKWMVNSQVRSAELKMNPAQLGPIEVKISVVNDQTTVMFTAQHGAVREAIDSAIPRLREMLGDNGMNLVDVDVSDRHFAQQEQASGDDNERLEGEYAEHEGDGSQPDPHGGEENADEGSVVIAARRMVDFYA